MLPKAFYFDQFKVKTIRVPENGKQSNETFSQHHVVNLIQVFKNEYFVKTLKVLGFLSCMCKAIQILLHV